MSWWSYGGYRLFPQGDPHCRGRLSGGGGQIPVPEAEQFSHRVCVGPYAGEHTYVRNIKKYLLAALYNAPATIDSYYASLVNHDLYGSGERR